MLLLDADCIINRLALPLGLCCFVVTVVVVVVVVI